MRRSGFDQCSGQLAEIDSTEKALNLVEEHDRLLDVLDIESDDERNAITSDPSRTRVRARMTLVTKTGRRFSISVEELRCRRCRLPRAISSEHERGCTWHPLEADGGALMHVYVTTKGEQSEGGSVLAVHKRIVQALAFAWNLAGVHATRVEGIIPAKLLSKTNNVVARWEFGCDFVEVARYRVL